MSDTKRKHILISKGMQLKSSTTTAPSAASNAKMSLLGVEKLMASKLMTLD
ncbi:hypothetical protein HanPI659440_Chr03g0101441 [Helianthus annuus]|nr:hypothetical protein HanPI659440_Chr03g0101441 [Helianthus annuus]